MNGWDLFTWFNAVILAGAAIVIFGFFLRDAKGILIGQRGDDDIEETQAQWEEDPGLLLGVSGRTLDGLDRS